MKSLAVLETRENTLEENVRLVQLGDRKLQNRLLKVYKPFIVKTVSEVCKRYISSTSDDEFSIGLSAFNEAMIDFSPEKGCSFLAFARLVIKRKTIDYIRKESKRQLPVYLDDGYNDEQMDNAIEVEIASKIYHLKTEQWHQREEIKALVQQLNNYQIGFNELINNAPKHRDARNSAIKVALTLYQNETMREYVKLKKQVPIKDLIPHVTVSKKTLERNRKFILALFVILDGDYIYLKEYLKGVG
ncbi:RNA polymerase sigma factor SigI [Paraliobacillus quinghaiensis]|uniref:RNA polymerase sigma factor SigI n=1 Tax=Paraliobacillus quinghaiensis TaxID=470815 RepID=A0A917TKH7_9BACI|nr:RNA polymerase sigma-I factor [Paraliobacillus quinghaiensis]GGM25898.1 RNA polymerase sigma factor SigI [Paraliobacillus quinghaiensis]